MNLFLGPEAKITIALPLGRSRPDSYREHRDLSVLIAIEHFITATETTKALCCLVSLFRSLSCASRGMVQKNLNSKEHTQMKCITLLFLANALTFPLRRCVSSPNCVL